MKRNTFAIVVLCWAAGSAPGGTFDLSWHSIDGGGVVRSTGGDFELSGTIGQPDAGFFTGGNFELSGGFWLALAPTDCNEDGAANLLDYDLFTQCMGGPNSGVSAGCECFDIDRSGTIDLRDFATMQAAFTGP